MDLNIGDIVRVRKEKDLWCEYGPTKEPYPNDTLGFRPDYIGLTGVINRIESNMGHTAVLVQYSDALDMSWWYYPEVLIKAEVTD